MPYTTNKNIEKPAYNGYVNSWNTPVNADWDIIDAALGSTTSLNATGGSATLSTAQYQSLFLSITGAISAPVTYTIPSGVDGQWIVYNGTTDSSGGPNAVTIASAGGGTSVATTRGGRAIIISDGTNIRRLSYVEGDGSGIIPVANGGTGASTAATARTNLGVVSAAEGTAGLISIATQAETSAGTNDTNAITPLKLTNISPASAVYATGDQFLILDVTDSNKLKKSTVNVGKLVQQIYASTSAYTSGASTVSPYSIPQSSATQYISATISPTSTSNYLLIQINALLTPSSSATVTAALFKDSDTNALAATATYVTTNAANTISLIHRMAAPSTSSITFKFKAGTNNGVTLYINGDSSGQFFGGVAVSSITISEIAA